MATVIQKCATEYTSEITITTVPLPNDEIIPILKQCGLKLEIQVDFKVGDVVNVVSGTFAGQEATVESFDVEKQIVTVLVDFFGRQTPQELRFDEVEVIK